MFGVYPGVHRAITEIRRKHNIWGVFSLGKRDTTQYMGCSGRCAPERQTQIHYRKKTGMKEIKDASCMPAAARAGVQDSSVLNRPGIVYTAAAVFHLRLTWNHNMYAENVFNKGILTNGEGTK